MLFPTLTILCCVFHNDTLGSSELSFRAGRSETQSPPFSKVRTFFAIGLYWIHGGSWKKNLQRKAVLLVLKKL